MTWRIIGLIVCGALILLWPRGAGPTPGERYDRRLAELQSGAEERFFEEKRSLLAYPPRWRGQVPRVLGAFFMLMGLGLLLYLPD